MEASNKPQILDALLKNRPLLFVVLVILVLVPIIILLVSLNNRPPAFALVSTSPANGSTIGPQETNIILEFNQDMPVVQKDTFKITITPEVEFVYGILDKKLQINIRDLWLETEQTYDVKIQNLLSRDNQVIRSLNTSLTVGLSSAASDFLSNLPYKGDGFMVDNISNRTLYVEVTGKPETKYEESSRKLLSDMGLIPTKFNIDISLPSERINKFDDDLIRH